MLTNLHVQNLAIIDEIDIQFKEGLTVITGETGAGKSLIIDAINLLIGAKASPSLVRAGATKATIEGVFDNLNESIIELFNEFDIEDTTELILRRDIYATGKSTFRVNGITLTATQIEKICDNLVDIQVQHDTLRLFNPKNYLSFIDDDKVFILLDDYKIKYDAYLKLHNEYFELLNNKDESDKNIDFIKFQLDEINKANLVLGEEEQLLDELKILNNFENIYQYLQNIKSLINDNNISDDLYEISDYLKKLKMISPQYLEHQQEIENAYYAVDELNSFIKSELSSLEFDEYRLNEINDRIDIISRLKRKYKTDVQGLIDLKEELKKSIDSVDNFDFFEKELNIKLKKAYEELVEAAKSLTKQRKINAENLKSHILATLKDLLLDKVKLEFVFNDVLYDDYLSAKVFHKNGVDSCDILISFNPGESLKPLSKTASGGEMSRVMLALKTHLFVNRKLSLVIFDEIDTGMSGIVAEGVAKKLKEMSKNMQVFSITHLPIVASVANDHLYVKKEVSNDVTSTNVLVLNDDQRIDVLAEMISPSDTIGKAKEVAKLMIEKNL